MRIRMTVMAALAVVAGTVGLYPLFIGKAWFWIALGSVVAVAAGGTLARRLRFPAVLVAAGGMAALLLYLTALFASAEALLGFVPTPDSLGRLRTLAGEGWRAANNYAAPVPLVPGIRMLTGAGVGLVAVVVDLLAVRLRRAAPAGLPLLAMYSVPAAVRQDSVGWLAFAVGALGYLGLLMADAREQVGGWGRAVFTPRWSQEVPIAGGADEAVQRRERAGAGAVSTHGRRIAFGAVAIAVLLPTVVPGIQPRGMFGLGGGGTGGGSQTITTPDPMVSLKRELTERGDEVVLTYRTDAGSRPDYLRMYALDQFGNGRWTFSQLPTTDRDRVNGRDLPSPPGLGPVQVRRVTTRVKVSDKVGKMTFLPMPYAPARVAARGDWRMDDASRMVYSPRDSVSGRSYTVVSTQAMPTARELAAGTAFPPEISRRYTAQPRSVPPEVVRLTRQVTRGAKSSHQQAVMLQRWFTRDGNFVYDLSAPPPRGGDDLTNFLLNDRRGYCEQYAAAFAVMARILGIPARVAMGYTPGTQTGPDEWTVRSRDAHAWPELYFEGVGWTRFEPTPAGPGVAGQGTAVTPPYSENLANADRPGRGEQASPSPSASSSAGPDGEASAGPQRRNDRPGDTGGLSPEEQDEGTPVMVWVGGAVLLLALLAAPMVARALARRRRWSSLGGGDAPAPKGPPGSGGGFTEVDPSGVAAHAAWRELHAEAVDHGLEWRPGDTPRQAARRLSEMLELDAETTQALGRLAHAEEIARYSRSRVATPPEALRADIRTVREAFSASVGAAARWRARLLPPSTMAATSGAAQSVTRRVGDRLSTPRRLWTKIMTRVEETGSRFRNR